MIAIEVSKLAVSAKQATRVGSVRRSARAGGISARSIRRDAHAQRRASLNRVRAAAVEAEPGAEASSEGASSSDKIPISDLVVGNTYKGKVKGVQSYGAFVDINAEGGDGLLHISEMSNDFVSDITEFIKEGQEVEVRVIKIEGKKFALSMKSPVVEGESGRAQRTGKVARRAPKRDAPKRDAPVKKGDVIQGTVARVAPFGVFVTVAEGFEGLLHQSEVKSTELEPRLATMFKEGEEVEVRVIKVDGQRVSLTQKTEEERQPFKSRAAEVDPSEVQTALEYALRAMGIAPDMFPSRPVEEDAAPAEKAAPAPAAEAAPAPAAEAAPAPPAPEKKATAAAAGGISAKAVKELREMSGAGMMDCKKALSECDGDIEKASEYLRKKGLASAGKKAGRVAAEGLISSYIHAGSRLGVMVELNCETDFVARGDKFKELAADVAMQIAACPDIEFVSVDEIPAEVQAREKEIEMGKEDLQSKPENIREKIVEGRVAKLLGEKCLLNQAYIKDTNMTVEELIKSSIAEIGENIRIRRFEKYNLGEGIEKKASDLGADIAEQTAAMKEAAEKKKDEAPKEEAPKEEEKPAVQVSAKAVKELREMSGAGMMDCKKALAQCDNDIEKASEYLRKKGLASAGKKAGRAAAEGLVVTYIHAGSRLGVLAELNCETDFVARGDKFKELAADMAMQIAACPDIEYVSVDEIPAEVQAREKEIEMGKEDLQSKPEDIRAKIVEGRVAKLLGEKCLLNQAYIKDTNKTVEEVLKGATAEIGENIVLRRFTKYNLGEGIEKKTQDFASEVAEAAKL
ncbi:unnamed protein product [Pedinophyceae sp. YPF-701]|nr:unnamed protein product [Pedinophyceae sp. YPF-701]